MLRYFVSYVAQTDKGYTIGNTQFDRLKPLTEMNNIRKWEDFIKISLIKEGFDVTKVVIVNWRKF